MLIKTNSGFEIDFNATCMNNMELLDQLVAMETGDILAVSKICNLIFSKEDKQRLYDHVKEKDGRVPLEKIDVEINEIFSLAGNQGKN